MTETVNILQGLPWVGSIDGPGRPVFDTADIQLDWDFVPTSSGGGMAFAFDDGRVKTFTIGGELSTPVDKVIESYGNPSHVYISRCDVGKCVTHLIYLTTGMEVSLFLDWDHDSEGDVVVTPTDGVTGIRFFIPGEKGYMTASAAYVEGFPNQSFPWVGYTKYSFMK